MTNYVATVHVSIAAQAGSLASYAMMAGWFVQAPSQEEPDCFRLRSSSFGGRGHGNGSLQRRAGHHLQRRCSHSHWSGYSRIQFSTTDVIACMVP
jgi:hypothetical protein